MSKRKPQPQRVRSDVYTQALNAAKKRIQTALIEKAECEAQLTRLNQEIPQLQRIIHVFDPGSMESYAASPMDKESYEEMVERIKNAPTPQKTFREIAATVRPSPEALKQVPDHLKRFVQPQSEEQVPVNGNGEDQFLPDVE